MNNFHLSQNIISLQVFENQKIYSKFVEALEDALHRATVRTLKLPFRRILHSDRRMVRFIGVFKVIKKAHKRRWFSRLVDFSFYQLKMFRDLQRLSFGVKKKQVLKVLLNLKFYCYSIQMVRKKFLVLRKIMIRNRKDDFLHFFATAKEMSLNLDSPYEIPINKSPMFPFNRSGDSGMLDTSIDPSKQMNIFNHDETSDSKHYSYNRLENVETFQGFGSREENIIKNSNFNTFYQGDKESQGPEFQLNSYGTFNKFNDNWVKQASPNVSIRESTIEKKLVTIEDMGEEMENQSRTESEDQIESIKSESEEPLKPVVKIDPKTKLVKSGELSQVSGKSDQASLSVEKKIKERNMYTVNINDLMISRKHPEKVAFNINKRNSKIKETKIQPKKVKIHSHTNNFASDDLNYNRYESRHESSDEISKEKLIETIELDQKPNHDREVLKVLNNKPKIYDTKSRVKNEVFRQMDMIQKSKSQTYLRKKPFAQKLKKQPESLLKLSIKRSPSKKRSRLSSPIMGQSKYKQNNINSKFIKRYGRNKKNKSRSRSRIKKIMNELFDEHINSKPKVKGLNCESNEKSVDQLSWNVKKSAILKSDVSVINLKVQENFKNQMKQALDKINKTLSKLGSSEHKRKQVLQNFSITLDLYEKYLLTLIRSGRDSANIRNLITTIKYIGEPIKRGLSNGAFAKDLKSLNILSLKKIIAFLNNILQKDLLNSSMPCDSGSHNTNNFGTLSSQIPSQKYNSQLENTITQKRFGDMGLPVYSSEIFKRNISSPQFNLSNKNIITKKMSNFNIRRSKLNELKNFCILLNYKLSFKLKRQLKYSFQILKQQPRKFKGRGWKKFPRILVYLLKRKILVSIKALKVNRLQVKIREAKKSSKRKKKYFKRSYNWNIDDRE